MTNIFRCRYGSICANVPGGNDGTNSMVAEKFFCPRNKAKYLTVNYYWWNGVKASPPASDIYNGTTNGKYDIMATTGAVPMEDQVSTGDGTKSLVSFGLEELKVGDTLKIYGINFWCTDRNRKK